MEILEKPKKAEEKPHFPNDVLRVIYTRRAVRKYKNTPLSKELIDQLLDAGRMAPSAINKQPWKFYVLTDKQQIKLFSREIAKAAAKTFWRSGLKTMVKTTSELLHFSGSFIGTEDPVFHGAPAVIFIASPKGNEWAPLDVGMCAQNIMLAAKSLGLDSCPVGFGKFAEQTKVYPQLRVGKNERINLSIIIGYGDEQPQVHPRIRDNAVFL